MTLASDLAGLGLESVKAGLLGNHSVGSTISLSVEVGKTATGSTITDAYPLTRLYTLFTTVAISTGARIPGLMDVGSVLIVKNRGANALTVYPDSASGVINGGSAGAGLSIAVGATISFRRTSATTFEA